MRDVMRPIEVRASDRPPRLSYASSAAGNLAMLHREIGRRFKSYTLTGTIHSITREPEFYAAEEGGVKLSDWVAALLDDKSVPDVGNGLLNTPK